MQYLLIISLLIAIYWTTITFVAIYTMLADDSCLFQETGKLIIRVFQYFDLENRILKYMEIHPNADAAEIGYRFQITYSDTYTTLYSLYKRGKLIKTPIGYKLKNQ